jgi:hypothetical protein
MELQRIKRNAAAVKSRLRGQGTHMRTAIDMGTLSHGKARQNVPGYLAVKKSGTPGAGSGVFALRAFKKDQPILMCTGRYVLKKDQRAEQLAYSFDIPGYDLVALQCFENTETNIIKFVNSNHGTSRQQNAMISWHGPVAILYALAHIPRGQELLMDYTF